MADEADSKSVVGNHVWVQVPLPALFKEYCKITFFFRILVFTGFVEYQIKNKNLKSGIKISCFTPKCNTNATRMQHEIIPAKLPGFLYCH
jgi:hypothetical protein